MSLNPVGGLGPEIVPLTRWTENSISAIYKAPKQNDFNHAFDAFIAEDAHITVNGKHLSRAQYKELLQGERALEQSASVSFLGAVEVPAHTKELEAAGTVGVYYKATIYEGIRIRDALRSSTINSSMNVVIEGSSSFDHKVTKVDQVIIDRVNPILIQTPLGAASASA